MSLGNAQRAIFFLIGVVAAGTMVIVMWSAGTAIKWDISAGNAEVPLSSATIVVAGDTWHTSAHPAGWPTVDTVDTET